MQPLFDIPVVILHTFTALLGCLPFFFSLLFHCCFFSLNMCLLLHGKASPSDLMPFRGAEPDYEAVTTLFSPDWCRNFKKGNLIISGVRARSWDVCCCFFQSEIIWKKSTMITCSVSLYKLLLHTINWLTVSILFMQLLARSFLQG